MAKTSKKAKLSAPTTEPISIRVEKAENGFIISRFNEKGRKQIIAKNIREVVKIINSTF